MASGRPRRPCTCRRSRRRTSGPPPWSTRTPASAADWVEHAEDEALERVTLVEAPTERLLTKALGRIGEDDVAIVDTPPGNERFLAKAIDAADAVIIPTRIGGVETAAGRSRAGPRAPQAPGRARDLLGRTYTRDYQDVVAAWVEAERAGVGERARAGGDRRRPRGLALADGLESYRPCGGAARRAVGEP